MMCSLAVASGWCFGSGKALGRLLDGRAFHYTKSPDLIPV